jgi:predicted nucleic acid-binding Zn ribbon protein
MAAKVEAKAALVKHKHCPICQTPISMSKDFCSKDCEQESKRMDRSRRNRFILLMMMFPILFLILSFIGNWFR